MRQVTNTFVELGNREFSKLPMRQVTCYKYEINIISIITYKGFYENTYV